jgi:hypothetical protein
MVLARSLLPQLPGAVLGPISDPLQTPVPTVCGSLSMCIRTGVPCCRKKRVGFGTLPAFPRSVIEMKLECRGAAIPVNHVLPPTNYPCRVSTLMPDSSTFGFRRGLPGGWRYGLV